MKNKIVVNVRCHVGVYQFAGQQALDRKKLEDCTMELNSVGVFVKAKMGDQVKQMLIPFANITGIELADDEEAKK